MSSASLHSGFLPLQWRRVEKSGHAGMGHIIPLCPPRRGERAGGLISFRGNQSWSHPGVRAQAGALSPPLPLACGGHFPSIGVVKGPRGRGEACAVQLAHPKSVIRLLRGSSAGQAGGGGKGRRQVTALFHSTLMSHDLKHFCFVKYQCHFLFTLKP